MVRQQQLEGVAVVVAEVVVTMAGQRHEMMRGLFLSCLELVK